MLNFSQIFTQTCLFCGANAYSSTAIGNKTIGSTAICAPCLADLPWHNALSCPQCGLASAGDVCGRCLKQPPHFDSTIALFDYAYPIDSVLQHYKYLHALHLTHTLGALFSDYYLGRLNAQNTSKTVGHVSMPDALLAMPLHPKRLQERGFNQSLEIAKVLADKLKLPLLTHHSKRIKNTVPQAQLKLKDRAKNIKNAFACEPLTGMRVALVDDVMTSGASLNELALTAKRAGATEVQCWVLARTP
jgi:ComF family protein